MRRMLLCLVTFLAPAAPASAASRPDLAVGRITTSAVTVGPCTAAGCDVRVAVTARVVNRGTRRAARTKLAFFLSRDGRRDRGDVEGLRAPVRAIRGGRARSADVAVSLTGVAPGVYRLIACADVARRIRERGERNNCRASRAFTVRAPLVEPPLAPPAAPAPAPTAPQAPAGCQEDWRRELCALITEAVNRKLFLDMADVVSFALLFQHHRTGQSIPNSIAAGAIETVRRAWDPVRGQTGLPNYRVAGFLGYWADGPYGNLEWQKYPGALDTAEEFGSWWQTYLIVQNTARQNAINQTLNAILQSELAWRNAMDGWKAYDLRLLTAQQYSDATVFAHRTLEDARAAVDAASSAIKP
jgi:hypothetical protein